MILNNTQANIFKVNGGIADNFANRPAANGSFYIFYSLDTQEIFYDNGAWVLIGSGGGGVNIYNSDGTLTGPRDVFCNQNNLRFREVSLVRFDDISFSDSFVIDFAGSQEKIYTRFNNNDIGLKLDFANSVYEFGELNNGIKLYIDYNNNTTQLGDIGIIGYGIYLNIDSAFGRFETFLGNNIVGLKLDFANTIYQFGQITGGNNTNLYINDTISFLGTYYNTLNQGLQFDFSQRSYSIGHYSNFNQTYLNIADTLEIIQTRNKGNNNGFNLNFSNRTYKFGQLTANNLTSFNIEDNGGFIYCLYQNNGVGFSFQSNINNYQYGQISGGNLSKLIINDLTNQIYLSNANVFNGWFCDFNTKIYRFGQINGGNLTRYVIDDNNAYPLGVEGNNITSGSSGGSSGQHLKINVNGVSYKIRLENP